MSIGIGAAAILEAADSSTLLYFYYSYNVNLEGYKQYMEKYDGEIVIDRSSLVEPDTYIKRIKKASGKKVFEERIRKKDYNIEELIKQGKVTIVNSSGAWNVVDGIDIMAIRLVSKIFDKYQSDRDIPERVGFYS